MGGQYENESYRNTLEGVDCIHATQYRDKDELQ
jgi:hypothetical protein